jgi:hypothetical protein
MMLRKQENNGCLRVNEIHWQGKFHAPMCHYNPELLYFMAALWLELMENRILVKSVCWYLNIHTSIN